MKHFEKSHIKKCLFQGFIGLNCLNLYSQSILIILYAIKSISELTIVNFSNLITDPAFAYLLKIYHLLTIQQTDGSLLYPAILVTLIMVGSLIYFYCLFSYIKDSQRKEIKSIVMSFFGLFIFTFRAVLVKNLAQIGSNAYQQKNWLFIVFIAIAITLIILQSYLIQQFCTQISLMSSKKSLLSKSYHFFNGISEVLLLLSTIFTAIVPDDNMPLVSILSVSISIAFMLKLISSACRKKYSNQLTEFLQRITCMAGVVFYIGIIPGYFVEILKLNLFFTMIIVLIFAYTSYAHFLSYFQQQSLLYLESMQKSKQDLKNRKNTFYFAQAHFLVHYVNYMMVQYKGDKQQILLNSILSEHFRVCKNQQCYCQSFHDQNKSKLITDANFRGKFLLSFVQNIYKQFDDEFDIFILYLVFKFQIVGIFPQVEFSLIKYEMSNPSLKISQQFVIYQVKLLLKDFIQSKNKVMTFVRIQKALQEQQRTKKIISYLKEIIDLNIRKFKLLSQGICNLRLVQENVQKTCEIVKQVQLEYLESKRKNQFNLYTQNVFYFYFTKICQTNSEITELYQNIYAKSNYLKCLKGMDAQNLQKIIYDDRCCVIESNLDTENMGTITNVTQNSQLVFGLRKQELIYRNVKKIIPNFMDDEHVNLMKNWANSGSLRILNKQKITFATTVKNICFKAMIYLRINTSTDRIKIYIMILKLIGDNYLLLDKNLKIEGYGQKIKDSIFTIKALKQPLKNYCLNHKALPYDIEDLTQQTKLHLDLLISQQKNSLGQFQAYQQDESNFVQKIKNFANKALRANRQIRVLKCKVQLSIMRFGNLSYCVVKFLDVTQLVMFQSDIDEIEEQNHTINKLSKKKILLGQNSSQPYERVHQNKQFTDHVNGQQKTQNQDNNSNSAQHLSEMQEMQNQSTSSMMSQEVSYSFKKLIKIIKEKFLFQKNVTYRQLNNITIVLFILVTILLVALFVQYAFYKDRLVSFDKVIIANQQVSDTLQYLQIMFSKILLVYQKCLLIKDNLKCQQMIFDIQYTQNLFYYRISQQFENILSLKANSDFQYYQYLRQTVKPIIGKSYSQMSVSKFIQVFYYTVQKLTLYFKTLPPKQTQLDPDALSLLKTLTNNWELIVQINHNILEIYEEKGLSQMSLITIVLYSITSFIGLVNIFIVITINYFIKSSIKKRQSIVRNYQYVPIIYVEQMKKYFENAMQMICDNKLNRNEDLSFPLVLDNSYYRPKNQFFYIRSSLKRIILLILFFISLELGNYFSLQEMKKVIDPFEHIFIQERTMINSQKKIIEQYYQLKNLYLTQKDAVIRGQKLSILQSGFQKRQIQFNNRAVILLQIFPNSENDFFSDFKKLLSNDVCELARSLVTQKEYTNCKQASYPYPQYGIFSTMIYIQRVTLIACQVLKTTPIAQAVYVFDNPTYQDIDLYIIYAVKVFELMQKRINLEMRYSLDRAQLSCLLTTIAQTAILMVGGIFWCSVYMNKKKQLIKLYGHSLVFPNRIIKKNKKVMKNIQQNLVIKQF